MFLAACVLATVVERQGRTIHPRSDNRKFVTTTDKGKAPVPTPRLHSAAVPVECETGLQLDTVLLDGEFLRLDDGSLWHVDYVDRGIAASWSSASDVLLCDERVVNVEEDEEITVSRVLAGLGDPSTTATAEVPDTTSSSVLPPRVAESPTAPMPPRELISLRVALNAETLPPLLLYAPRPDKRGHDVFLGCLNCPEDVEESVWREFGDFAPYHGDSIWNQWGPYGSDYARTSPWSLTAEAPPVLVDSSGNFYGYFTVIETYRLRTSHPFPLWVLENHDWIVDHLDTIRALVR